MEQCFIEDNTFCLMDRKLSQQQDDCRPTTKDSTATSFRGSRRTNRQYFSLKKNHSNFSESAYAGKSPTRGLLTPMKKCSLSPDRKNAYWQNWLLPEQMRKPVNTDQPTIASSAVCAIYSDNNQLFMQQNSHNPRQVASLTKIMTAFTVIHICSTYGVKIRQTWVPIQKEAATMEGTSANLRIGEEVLVIDLLYGLMLPSGNDAAIALAMYFGKFLSFTFSHEHLYNGEDGESSNMDKFSAYKEFYDSEYCEDSIKLFVFEMNKNCQKIGLKKTNFTNPTGLGDPKSYSTAHDIACLISFCMRNHLLRSIFKKKNYVCESRNLKMACTRTIEWKNTNRHLFLFKDCIGVKTGITPAAGPCLSTAYRVMGRELIVVILNSQNLEERYVDSEKIYKFAKTKLQLSHQYQTASLSPPKRTWEPDSLNIGLPVSK